MPLKVFPDVFFCKKNIIPDNVLKFFNCVQFEFFSVFFGLFFCLLACNAIFVVVSHVMRSSLFHEKICQSFKIVETLRAFVVHFFSEY